ncbi:alpha-N-arabinofuranosidase [Desertihabitans brevis]|uniref:alpha-N-arabinofuranosidase n=1 Tax=Desertihabitans brevis TaxID=2268447 RepID=UPI001F39A48F|nr:alpha-L-arabinofuranosidase C-terminal domain-containing protein [Desertihabitans brevis]
MSEWVEYLTRAGDSPMVALRRQNGRDEPWKVPFWGLGNETWGCGGHMRAEAYADLARQYATYCRDHGDHQLYRIAAGAADDDLAWTEALMKAIGGLGCRLSAKTRFQAVSFHYYTHAGDAIAKTPATEFSAEQWYGTLQKGLDIDRVIRGHSAVMDAYDPDRQIGLVCDEWGTWWSVEEGTNPGFLYQQNTVRDALVASTHLDIFHRHAERLVMANIAQTVNVLQAMLLTDPDTEALVLTPSYHVFEMNKGHQSARRLPVHVLDGPRHESEQHSLELLSVSASAKDGTALVSLSNLSLDAAQEVALDLRGLGFACDRARVLTADEPQAHNSAEHPDRVRPEALDVRLDGSTLQVTLPPHSFATCELTLS